jgi:hypothetical protein
MSCCTIYKKPFLFDIDYNQVDINLSTLSQLIPPFDPDTSGIWRPIIIQSGNAHYVDPLIRANNSVITSFDPLNCIPSTAKNYTELESDPSVNCTYCSMIQPSNYTKPWQLKDTAGNTRKVNSDAGLIDAYITSDCCNGACDTRMKVDDYLPKIPVINQNYLTSFYDFKYLKEFPATNNPGLGYESFVKLPANSLKSFETSPSLRIDWKLRETISEIIYDEMTSQHINIDQHNKSFNKSFNTNKTCGNFILTQINPSTSGVHPDYPFFSGLIGDSDQSKVTLPLKDLLPSVSGFTNPYGFSKNTYDNIFVHNERLGSHWKWNYSSGVLCWYRYYDVASSGSGSIIQASGDNRPIRNVDLYISPGDVFFATNDGPEPLTPAYSDGMDIKCCPSGLKLLKNNSVTGVIPSGSNFTYISSNLYDRFIELYTKIDTANKSDNRTMTPKQKFDLAALLCTAPEYDEITLDLYKRNSTYKYEINSYIQISGFNKNMNTTPIGSVSKLNFIRNKEDLVNTLADKYGCYLWCPPNQTTDIKLKNNIKNQCLVDLEFDMVLDKNDTKFNNPNCSPTTECLDNISTKSFVYNQLFSLGNINFSTITDKYTRYNAICSGNTMIKTQSAKTAASYLNDSLIKEIVYSSGCSIYQDNYPRILSSGTTNSCSGCGSDSTYLLPIVKSESICKDYYGDLSWCDYPSARFYNNSEGGNIVGDRLSRSILDGSLYFKRSYTASVFNPHIDRLAFHNQGGIYYICNALGAISGSTAFVKNATSLFNDDTGGKLSLTFNTKDVGIKIYNISIEKIRGPAEDSYSCKAFPIKDSCKCFGLSNVSGYPHRCSSSTARTYTNQNKVLYTPALSTQNSPRLKAYGGYSLNKLAELLGGAQILENISRVELQIVEINKTIVSTTDLDALQSLQSRLRELSKELEALRNSLSAIVSNPIPGHPAVNSSLQSVNAKIDPLNPYGCNKSVTITLNNYASTNWTVTLPSYNTIHADVWAEILEGVNLFKANNFSSDPESGDFISTPNLGYQRFTTKVNLNDITIYDQQKKLFINKGAESSATVTIGLSNPYLKSLLGAEFYLYPPTGNFCETNNIFSTRGDEISSVPIKFSREPRKQILNFSIPPYSGLGNLRKGFFHPNSGLSFASEYHNITPIVHDSGTHSYYIDYEKDKFRTGSSYSGGLVLVGQLNSDIERILTQINNSSDHRKLRLYLKLENQWYLYDNPNSFGFFNKENLYIGEPFMFEYLSSENKATIQGPWLPSCPKEPLEFDFVYNYKPTGTSILDYNIDNYPLCIVSAHKDPNDPTTAKIAGSRPYFYISEKENVVVSVNDSIESLSQDEQALINADTCPVVLLKNGDRWRYLGGSKTSLSSYQLTDYNYLFQNFSDLNINYALKNKLSYVYGSRLSCDQEVTIINKDNPKQKYTSKIIEKSIYCRNTDKYGRILSFNSTNPEQYIKIFTQIKLDRQLKYDNCDIDFSTLYNNFQGSNGVDSLILYRNFNPLLQKELDSFLDNPAFSTKWADLIDFDDKLNSELSNYIYSSSVIHDNYPLSQYNNLFNKIIVNNNHYNIFNYIIKPENASGIQVSYTGLVYYTIHQKYNIGSENYLTKKDFHLQDNYLPLMDLNFIPNPGVNTQSLRPQLSGSIQEKLSNDKLLNGKIIISGLYKNLASNHEWQPFQSPNTTRYFWLNINPNNKLKSALSFNDSTRFYSNTLRIDDPPFTLSSLTSELQFSESDCLRSFTASVPQYRNFSLTSSLNFAAFDTQIFKTDVFARYPIYCDTDSIGSCGGDKCGINTAGWTTLKADYSIYKEKTKAISGIPSDNIPFMLSYDAGLYNIIGNNDIKYIQRFELDPNNVLYPVSNCDASVGPRPAAEKYSVLNPEYQSLLSNSIVSDHTSIVKNTDILANEMLFRLLYGEQQRINLQRIDNSEKPLTLIDLLRYSYPKVEAKDVYKNIPYDLDINADILNRKINGSINISGILEVGKIVNISINNLSITIKISRISGKIKAIATISNHSDLESIIYSESITNTNLVVSTQELSPANDLEKYNEIGRCKERPQQSFNLISKIISAQVETIGCSGDTETFSFPFWADEDYPKGRKCNFGAPYYKPLCSQSENIPPEDRGLAIIYFDNNEGCANTNALPYFKCTNRGVGPVVVRDPRCRMLSSRVVSIDPVGGISRGVFGGVHGPFTTPNSDRSYNNGGPIESMITSTVIPDVGAISLNPRYESSACGTCFTLLDDEDKKHYNNLASRDWPPSSTSTSDACECSNYEYGYCRSSDKIDGCACSSLNYEYSDFDYTFEYCRHSITLKGYKRKLVGYLSNPSIITDPTPPRSPVSITATATTPNRLSIREQCGWVSCQVSNPETYYIYNKDTITNYNKYSPSCSAQLCNISYDNNNLTISLAGGASKCIPNSIRSDCPSISITVPDDSFSVVDSINSECSDCGVEPNQSAMINQHPSWDIITETRTCVLGYLVQGNPNQDGPTLMGGCTTIDKVGADPNACNGATITTCGVGQCGKSAPDSFPWHTCISRASAIIVGGNIDSVIAGCETVVQFENGSAGANGELNKEWEANMQQAYSNIAACKNNKDKYQVNDIVEGVVPGTCSKVNFGIVKYPAIHYRATLGDPALVSVELPVRVAYYTYQYRRPKTIQDILKGVDTSIKCNERATSCINSNIKLSSTYKTIDCDTSPSCYNTEASKCDENRACCQANKVEYE